MQSRHKFKFFDVFNLDTFFTKASISSTLLLMIGLCVTLNPDITNSSTMPAYAEDQSSTSSASDSNIDSGISPTSLDPDSSTISIRFDDAPADDPDAYMINLTNNDVKANEVAYISTNFTVSSYQTKEYIISLNSMNGSIGKLVGRNNPFATIDGVGTNVVPGTDGEGFAKNTWGYTIGNKDDTNYAVETATYNSVPAYGEMVNVVKEVIDKPTATPRDDKYKLTFAAKIGDDSPADHYQTKVYLSVVRTAGRTYTVTYNGNKPSTTNNEPTNVPGKQTFIETSEIHDFTLTTQKPTLDGYEFLGWNTNKDATTATYQPGGNFTIAEDTDNEISLYAIWKNIPDAYTLNFDANGGSGAPGTQTYSDTNHTGSHTFSIPSTIPIKNGYSFQGWATTSTATTKQYDAGGSITLQKNKPSVTLYAIWKEIITWNTITKMQDMTPEICASAPPETPKTLTDTRDGSTYSVTKLRDNAAGTINRCWMTQNLRLINAMTLTSDDTDLDDDATYTISEPYHNSTYGAYYQWPVATAGTGTNSGSICPKGWQLPRYGESGSYASLAMAYNIGSNGNRLIQSPFYLAYSGYHMISGINQGGVGGYYWTSTVSGANTSYMLEFTASKVVLNSTQTQGISIPIRCVAKQ